MVVTCHFATYLSKIIVFKFKYIIKLLWKLHGKKKDTETKQKNYFESPMNRFLIRGNYTKRYFVSWQGAN